MIINLTLFIFLELGAGFCNTLPQLIGVRSLYGISMGGWSPAFLRVTPQLINTPQDSLVRQLRQPSRTSRMKLAGCCLARSKWAMQLDIFLLRLSTALWCRPHLTDGGVFSGSVLDRLS